MRNLADLEGKTVQYKGCLWLWKKLRGEDYKFLLTNVQISPFDPKDIRPIDHLWIYRQGMPVAIGKIERLTTVQGNGIVVKYQRKGTWDYDYSLKQINSICLETGFNNLNRYCRGRSTLARLEATIDFFEKSLVDINQGAVILPFATSLAPIRKDFEQALEKVRRDLEANKKRLQNAPRRKMSEQQIYNLLKTI